MTSRRADLVLDDVVEDLRRREQQAPVERHRRPSAEQEAQRVFWPRMVRPGYALPVARSAASSRGATSCMAPAGTSAPTAATRVARRHEQARPRAASTRARPASATNVQHLAEVGHRPGSAPPRGGSGDGPPAPLDPRRELLDLLLGMAFRPAPRQHDLDLTVAVDAYPDAAGAVGSTDAIGHGHRDGRA